MSDIRLIMMGSVMIFAGFYVGGIGGSEYSQVSLQASELDSCFDYSSGTAIHVNCAKAEQDAFLWLALAVALMGGGSYIIFRGIRGKWDQNVKNDEMLGPKNG